MMVAGIAASAVVPGPPPPGPITDVLGYAGGRAAAASGSSVTTSAISLPRPHTANRWLVVCITREDITAVTAASFAGQAMSPLATVVSADGACAVYALQHTGTGGAVAFTTDAAGGDYAVAVFDVH